MATKRKAPRPIKGFAATGDVRSVMRRAANDVEQGRQDTECRGEARTVRPRSADPCPRPVRKTRHR